MLATAASREPLRRVLGTPAPTAAEFRADADESAAYRARLIELFTQAGGDWNVRVQLLAEARDYDRARPEQSPLYDELHAIQLFGTQYSEAA